ncbi:E2/UBC family protein [Rhodanobacter umsongensis]|jgi:hypothetical protein
MLYLDASILPLPSGAHLIKLPNLLLPQGWDRTEVSVYFVTPPGYPAAQPDCFWTEQPLRLAGNPQPPQNSNETNVIPEANVTVGTWFSWHLQGWNPNQDSLVTYAKVIRQRLKPAR